MKSESIVQQEIQILAAKKSSLLMRNNSGALKDDTGRVVRYGLHNVSKKINDLLKSSDLIGITEVTITPDMVGKTIGVFTAVEVKKEDWMFSLKNKREVAQKNFIDLIKSKGGLAGFAKNENEFLEIINFK